MPRGAVASELAKEGKKKTIFLDETEFLGMLTRLLLVILPFLSGDGVTWASENCQDFVIYVRMRV
jgi:hypothetical protein